MKWQFTTSSPARGCPAIGTNGLIYFGSLDGDFYAVDSTTGALRWDWKVNEYGEDPPVIAPDGTVYVSGRSNLSQEILVALDGNTGTQKWVFRGAVGPSIAHDGTLYAGSENFYALDPADGRVLWARPETRVITRMCIAPNGLVYYGTSDGRVVALNTITRTIEWEFAASNSVHVAPVIARDGTVYVGSQDNRAYALDGATGEKLWQFESLNGVDSLILASEDTILLTTSGGLVLSVDRFTGQIRRDFGDLSARGIPAVAADGTVYVGGGRGVFALNSITGQTNWVFGQTEPGFFNSVAVDNDGTVYVGTYYWPGKVYAIHGSAPLANTSWPKFQQNPQNTGAWKVTGPPEITRQPRSRWAALDSETAFHFFAPVVRPLAIQWRFNGEPIPGATNESLRLSSVQFSDAGRYSVFVSNAFGTATSEEADLSVGYTLMANISGPGTVERDVDLVVYPTNAIVQLTAVPRSGRRFLAWSGAITGSDNPISITLRSNTQVTATFEYLVGDVKWSATFDDEPALGTNGGLYAFDDGYVTAIDTITGAIIFRDSYFDGWWAPGAIGSDGTFYIGNYNGSSVWAHDGVTGQQLWSFNVGVCVHACPAIGVDGTLYLAGRKIYAVDPLTRSEKWSFDAGNIFDSSPSLDADGNVYVGCYDGKVYALDRLGSKRWEFATGDGIRSSPALGTNETVYIGSRDDKVYALRTSNGEKRWEFDTGYDVDASPIIGADGSVYIGSLNKFYALDGETGVKKWDFTTSGSVTHAAALAADGSVYVAAGRLYALNSQTGEKRWDIPNIGISLTIGPDGTIYSGGHAIYATSPLANSPWPKFHATLDNRGRLPARPLLDARASRLTEAGFALVLHGEIGQSFTVEGGDQIGAWTPLRTFTNTTGRIEFIDSNPAPSTRFYRVTTP